MPKQDVVLSAGLDVKEFNRGLNSFINGLNQMEKQSQQASSSINQLGSSASTGIGVDLGVVVISSIQFLPCALTGLGNDVLFTL